MSSGCAATLTQHVQMKQMQRQMRREVPISLTVLSVL